jgi:hypothetical protein
VIEAAGPACGGGRSTDEVEGAVGRYPVDRDRLGERVAVEEDDVLGGKSLSGRSAERRSTQACCSLTVCRCRELTRLGLIDSLLVD